MPKEIENMPQGHITLKEAAKLSGYAPDYIGQLIRKGKIYGKQIYFNTAWITTEEAIKSYISQEKTGEVASEGSIQTYVQRFRNRFLSETRLNGMLRSFLYIGIGACVFFALILFYVLSVNIDRSLTDRAIRDFERRGVSEPLMP